MCTELGASVILKKLQHKNGEPIPLYAHLAHCAKVCIPPLPPDLEAARAAGKKNVDVGSRCGGLRSSNRNLK